MSLMDILSPYASRPTSTEEDFDEVAKQVPPEALGDAIAHAFRSDRTPAFGEMVGRLFGGSDPSLRAGLLNQLIAAAGPAVLGKLGSLLGNRSPDASTPISAADVQRISPEQASDLVHHPGVGLLGMTGDIGNLLRRNEIGIHLAGALKRRPREGFEGGHHGLGWTARGRLQKPHSPTLATRLPRAPSLLAHLPARSMGPRGRCTGCPACRRRIDGHETPSARRGSVQRNRATW